MIKEILRLFVVASIIIIVVLPPKFILAQNNPASYIPKGQKVEESSMCFSLPSAIKLKMDLEYCGKEEELKFDKKFRKFVVQRDANIKAMTIKHLAEKTKLEFLVNEQDDQIEFLNKKIEEIDKPTPWYKSNTLWFGTGVVVGVGVIIGVAYLLDYID